MPEGDGADQGSGQAQGAEGTQSGTGGGEEFDKDRALATIKAQRESENALKSELQATKTRLKEIEDKAKTAEESKLSEAEQTQKKIAELESKLEQTSTQGRARVAKAAIKAAAAKAGATYPDHIPKLIDADSVEYDDDGEPTNVDKLVEGLKKSSPGLFEERRPGSGDGGPRGSAVSNDVSKDDLLKSTGRL